MAEYKGLSRDVEVVSACLDAGLDYGFAVKAVWTDAVEKDLAAACHFGQ
jgi:hypothetical protein